MGREVRRVPPWWEHPRGGHGGHVPLYDGFAADVERWDREAAAWERGEYHLLPGNEWATDAAVKRADSSFAGWSWPRPIAERYMLVDCPAAERTHWQMYEDTTEGTPISPVMASPEALARWLADTGASAFANKTATYEQWLATIRRGSAVGLVVSSDGLRSGVAFQGDAEAKKS